MESSQTSAVELYYGNSQRIKAVDYFRRRAPSCMFDRILNATLPFTLKIGNILWNVWRRSRNFWWHSPEYLATFHGIFGDIPRSVWRHSPECLITFPGIFGDIPQNVLWYFPDCLATFHGMFGDISRTITFLPFPAFPAFRSPFLYSWFYT